MLDLIPLPFLKNMQFHSDGPIFKVVYITGPTHNFLALAFENEPRGVELLTLNSSEVVRLHVDDVQKAVMEGVEQANNELGTDYRFSLNQNVVSDSPPAEIYGMLAYRIVHRFHSPHDSYNGIEG